MKAAINICGVDFEVKPIEPNTRQDNRMGRCDTKYSLITIDKSMPEPVRELTLLHETIHAISDMSSLDLNENQVSVLANEINRLMKFRKP